MRSLVDRYRPKTWDDIVGQDHIVNALKYQNPDSRPNLLFIGSPGSGKTTVAKVYAKMNKIHIEMMNASDKRRIGDVRGKIKDIARTKGEKIIFLDEADNMFHDAQEALRGTMELPTKTIFILSGNRGDKLSEAIKSRCTEYIFNRLDDDVIMRKIMDICKAEEITWTKASRKGFKQLVKQCNGDLRKAINTLESIVGEGKMITEKTVMAFLKPQIADEIIESAIGGDFQRAREILEDAYINSNLDSSVLISDLYTSIFKEVRDETHQIRLIAELAKTQRGLNRDVKNDLIQLMGFVSYVWLIPHISDSCPVLRGDDEDL